MYNTYSEIENTISDKMFVYADDNKIKYPSAHCITPEQAYTINKNTIKSMKNGETIFLRQVAMPTIAYFISSTKTIPDVPKSEALDEYKSKYGGYFPPVDELHFPDSNNLSIDFASVHKKNGKYIFKVLEANGPQHSPRNSCTQQMVNDAMKEAILKALGVEKKHISYGVVDCSDKNTFIDVEIDWLANHE